MKLYYQVAAPDVAVAGSATVYQGLLDQSFGDLVRFGYDGVELMTLNPGELGWEGAKGTAERYGIFIALVYTGELLERLGLSYTSPEEEIRKEAIGRTKEVIDFAGYPGANINIGRVRGRYCARFSHGQTKRLAVEAFRELADYATPGNVAIALGTVTIIQTSSINTLAEGVCMVKWVDRPSSRLTMGVFHLSLKEKDLYQAIRDHSKYNIYVHPTDSNCRYLGHCGLGFGKILTAFKECGYDDNFCTEIFQIPSMKGAARGTMTCFRPIVERVCGRKATDRSGI